MGTLILTLNALALVGFAAYVIRCTWPTIQTKASGPTGAVVRSVSQMYTVASMRLRARGSVLGDSQRHSTPSSADGRSGQQADKAREKVLARDSNSTGTATGTGVVALDYLDASDSIGSSSAARGGGGSGKDAQAPIKYEP